MKFNFWYALKIFQNLLDKLKLYQIHFALDFKILKIKNK